MTEGRFTSRKFIMSAGASVLSILFMVPNYITYTETIVSLQIMLEGAETVSVITERIIEMNEKRIDLAERMVYLLMGGVFGYGVMNIWQKYTPSQKIRDQQSAHETLG